MLLLMVNPLLIVNPCQAGSIELTYNKMRVKEEYQSLLTIKTHLGLFSYSHLPFVISTVAAL